MNYSNDCGCSTPAPKPVKTLSVQPLAPTEEIVCPDARCMPHLLSSLPETDDAVPSYVGVYKGQSYIAPIRALVDAELMNVQNAYYREGRVPTVVDHRDIESLPVVQRGNCQKVGISAMPTVAKALMASLPEAPDSYEPAKVLTSDANGDVYPASPLSVVSPALVPAAIDNCEKGKLANVPVITQILGFGNSCKEFGLTSIKQLQEALSKVVPMAKSKTLPDQLRGWDEDTEYRYPVSLNAVETVELVGSISGSSAATASGAKIVFGKTTGPVLNPGVWIVNITFSGAIGWNNPSLSYINFGMETPIGFTAPIVLATAVSSNGTFLSHTYNVQRIVRVAPGATLALSADSICLPGGVATQVYMRGDVTFSAQQISQTNLVVNDVV